MNITYSSGVPFEVSVAECGSFQHHLFVVLASGILMQHRLIVLDCEIPMQTEAQDTRTLQNKMNL